MRIRILLLTNMPTLRDITDGKVIQAYGTSESVTKSWDTRGRGRHKKSAEDREKAAIALGKKFLGGLRDDVMGPKIRILPVDEQPPATKPLSGDKEEQARQLLQEHKDLGERLVHGVHKMEDIDKVKSTWGKAMHFLKGLGEWHDAWGNLRDLALESYVAMEMLGHSHAAAQTIHSALIHVMNNIGPAVQALHLTGMMGSSDLRASRQSKTLRQMVDGKCLL